MLNLTFNKWNEIKKYDEWLSCEYFFLPQRRELFYYPRAVQIQDLLFLFASQMLPATSRAG